MLHECSTCTLNFIKPIICIAAVLGEGGGGGGRRVPDTLAAQQCMES